MERRELVVAVVGATGAVGREMLSTLAERGFPADRVKAIASPRSAGAPVPYGEGELTVEALEERSFDGVSIALFSAGSGISREFAPIAVAAGAVVIDNSSAFRMEPDVPLVVPEVNGDHLRSVLAEVGPERGLLIANPNCSTIQLVVVLKPLHEAAGIRRVVVSTYQSVSGAGQKGMDELWEQTLGIFNQREVEPKHFPRQIAFNCIPHIDVFLENGYTNEEMKIVRESRKILGIPELRITSTAVRVPVFSCHAESVNVELERPLGPAKARELLRESPGILVMDDTAEISYPLQRELAGSDACYVGRVRRDESVENGLDLWVVADNLRKGAALNSIQIAEAVLDFRGR
ncbi:MAG: aspartate-semialdehyde dehydrogenase [Bdellovibrionales bacterium]|nr:aspartate-semialdehyde dehydrogenase [Bdellovibrionales bacterium]